MATIKVESPNLPTLGWAPTGGRSGEYPFDLSSGQRFVRLPRMMSPMPFPPMCGGVQASTPLYDVWAWNHGVAKYPQTFYFGGPQVAELGFTGPGVGGNPSNIPGLRG